MTLFEYRNTAALLLVEDAGSNNLGIDDVLSFGGDDLGLDIDAGGHLVLTEGVDFE